jgi:4-amino-4-deoxy-L-arabinose transferase-like glycosyltransferase
VTLAKLGGPLFVLIMVLAIGPRLAAAGFNVWPHGDVLLDAAVADSLAERGVLMVPLVDARFYPIGRFGFGYPPDQHPPLWSVLGAAVRLVWADSYEALKLLSLVAGLLLLPAVYVCGRDLIGPGPGLFVAALCAASYLLIDFAGNGSSWGLLALLYVLFVWRAGCFPLSDRRNAILLGLIMGAGYLTNYPAVVLPLTYILLLLWWRLGPSQPPFPPPHLPISPSRHRLLPLATALVVALPWLVFSTATFGNPIWSQPLERQIGGGDKRVELVLQDGELVKRAVPIASPLDQRLRETARNLYGNVGFLVRQSFVVAPLVGWLALAGLVLLAQRAWHGTAGARLPLLVLAFFHAGLIVLWPTTKFRYLVPLFPLVALLGAWLLWQVRLSELRNVLAAVALGAVAFTSAWTYARIPSHTYYYDGGVVTDNFGGQGEIAYVEELRHLEQAAAAIRAAPPGAVLGPHALYAMARRPLVIGSNSYSREIVEHLVSRYGLRYLVAEPPRVAFFASFLPGRVLWQDDRFAVYQVAF